MDQDEPNLTLDLTSPNLIDLVLVRSPKNPNNKHKMA